MGVLAHEPYLAQNNWVEEGGDALENDLGNSRGIKKN